MSGISSGVQHGFLGILCANVLTPGKNPDQRELEWNSVRGVLICSFAFLATCSKTSKSLSLSVSGCFSIKWKCHLHVRTVILDGVKKEKQKSRVVPGI